VRTGSLNRDRDAERDVPHEQFPSPGNSGIRPASSFQERDDPVAFLAHRPQREPDNEDDATGPNTQQDCRCERFGKAYSEHGCASRSGEWIANVRWNRPHVNTHGPAFLRAGLRDASPAMMRSRAPRP
jgi:hypothetical protein